MASHPDHWSSAPLSSIVCLVARFLLLPIIIPVAIAPVGWLAQGAGTAFTFYVLMLASCLAFPKQRSLHILGILAIGASLVVFLPGRDLAFTSWASSLTGLALATGPMKVARWRPVMQASAFAAWARPHRLTVSRALPTLIYSRTDLPDRAIAVSAARQIL